MHVARLGAATSVLLASGAAWSWPARPALTRVVANDNPDSSLAKRGAAQAAAVAKGETTP